MTPLLEIHRATVCRGGSPVLRDLSLTIRQHENLAILGPNGAGKSTLLKLLTRELYPVRQPGTSLRLFGRDHWNVRELRGRLGIVSHELQATYLPGTAARDVVLSGFTSSIGTHGVPHEFSPRELASAESIMARLDILRLARRSFARLSTGEQRRCLLARSLVAAPRCLILDEPLAGLDLRSGFDYLRRVEELMADGVSVVLVTHHVHEIPPGIERIVLLRDGVILADGPRREILTAARLGELYGTSLRIVESGGYFVALP